MTSVDFTPLFRSSIGFERLSRLLDTAMQTDPQAYAYPPYNIERLGNDHYRIVMAVAGFTADDIEITSEPNQLKIVGKGREQGEGASLLHRGIATRAFERRFQLADHIRVDDAGLKDGLLTVELVREIPEALKPRRIEIQSGEKTPPVVENKSKSKAA
ncbi:MAG: Hsp20 family protein [Pseudomonadota bacterium]